jgi:hypothetical protein
MRKHKKEHKNNSTPQSHFNPILPSNTETLKFQ